MTTREQPTHVRTALTSTPRAVGKSAPVMTPVSSGSAVANACRNWPISSSVKSSAVNEARAKSAPAIWDARQNRTSSTASTTTDSGSFNVSWRHQVPQQQQQVSGRVETAGGHASTAHRGKLVDVVIGVWKPSLRRCVDGDVGEHSTLGHVVYPFALVHLPRGHVEVSAGALLLVGKPVAFVCVSVGCNANTPQDALSREYGLALARPSNPNTHRVSALQAPRVGRPSSRLHKHLRSHTPSFRVRASSLTATHPRTWKPQA